ncbi:MAG: phage tail tape measure protein [Rhodocyclaceae bacterium]|nr:phage tail tape measure protein [Rhodocyclaceae bacterium]MCA3097490.1 phage tail tape measure protein [Rhodocyclaceae bacterium]
MAQSEARIRISATDDTKQAFESVRSNMERVKQSAEAFRATLGASGLAGAAAAVSAVLVAQTRSAINLADSLDDLSQRTGVAVEALSKLRVAPELADISMEQLTVGLKEFNKSLIEATDDTSKASQIFRALGVDISGSTEQSLSNAAAAFQRLEDGALKSTLATELFGKQGLAFIPLLNTGAEGLAKAAAQAEKFGLVISADFARQSGEFNDNLRQLRLSAEGLGIALGGPVVSGINAVIRQLGILDVQTDTSTKKLREFQRIGPVLNPGALAPTGRQDLNDALRQASRGQSRQITIARGRDDLEGPDTAALTCVAAGGRWDGTRCNTPAPARAAGGADRSSGAGGVDAQTRALLANLPPDDDTGVDVVGRIRGVQERAAERAGQLESLVSDTLVRRTAQLQQQVELLNSALTSGEISATEFGQAMDRLLDPTDQAGEATRRLAGEVEALFGETAIARARRLQTLIDEINRQTEAGGRSRAEADQVIADLFGTAQAQTNDASRAARDLGLTFSSAFEAAIGGSKSFRDILKGLESDLLRLGTRRLVTEPLLNGIESIFGGATGGGAGGGFSNIFSSIVGAFGFGGARAAGGPVSAGMGYLVGEKGPELFLPRQSGSIVPNGAMGGATIVFNVSTPDANSFRQSQGQMLAQAHQQMARAGRRNG